MAETITIDQFAADFVENLPAKAEGGVYYPNAEDRWAGRVFDIADGKHVSHGWSFKFLDLQFKVAERVA